MEATDPIISFSVVAVIVVVVLPVVGAGVRDTFQHAAEADAGVPQLGARPAGQTGPGVHPQDLVRSPARVLRSIRHESQVSSAPLARYGEMGVVAKGGRGEGEGGRHGDVGVPDGGEAMAVAELLLSFSPARCLVRSFRLSWRANRHVRHRFFSRRSTPR